MVSENFFLTNPETHKHLGAPPPAPHLQITLVKSPQIGPPTVVMGNPVHLPESHYKTIINNMCKAVDQHRKMLIIHNLVF